MRPIASLLLPVAFAAGVLMPSAVQAQEFNATLKSRYLDDRLFNDVFSNEPSLQVAASFDLTNHTYVSAYAYTGFKKPFSDASSEYGFEAGGQWQLASTVTLNLAAGRYANYLGRGFTKGDWYAKAAITQGHLSISGIVLHGASDTVLVNVTYELPITKRLTLTPNVAYFTASGKINPALQAKYRLTDALSIGAGVVLPKDSLTGKRKLYGAVSVAMNF